MFDRPKHCFGRRWIFVRKQMFSDKNPSSAFGLNGTHANSHTWSVARDSNGNQWRGRHHSQHKLTAGHMEQSEPTNLGSYVQPCCSVQPCCWTYTLVGFVGIWLRFVGLSQGLLHGLHIWDETYCLIWCIVLFRLGAYCFISSWCLLFATPILSTLAKGVHFLTQIPFAHSLSFSLISLCTKVYCLSPPIRMYIFKVTINNLEFFY
jgi:hypothetical protein